MFPDEKAYRDFTETYSKYETFLKDCKTMYAAVKAGRLADTLDKYKGMTARYGTRDSLMDQLDGLVNSYDCVEIDVAENSVNFSGEVPACKRGCCGDEYVGFSMPTRVLWEPHNIAAIVEEEIQECVYKLEVERENNNLKLKEQEKKREEKELEQYEKLREKFKDKT